MSKINDEAEQENCADCKKAVICLSCNNESSLMIIDYVLIVRVVSI
ncbi:hypothetical protein LCGC14_0835190 [marine sediment metagenome]|uniref:Uncharacterized protein n=1 Tax=marine sediment metagenome TaxID=412755 RepID=A0A0F9PJH8_9ZZZZ